MSRKFRNTFIVVLLVGLLAGGVWYYYNRYLPAQKPAAPALQTAKVRTGDIIITASGSGNLVPAAEWDLSFRSGGVLIDLPVKVGSAVKSGDVLARLDDAAIKIQMAQAQINLEQAQDKLITARDTLTPTQAVARSNLDAAQASYQAVLRDIGSRDDRLTSARVNLSQATTALSDAQAVYDVAYDPGRDWELGVPALALRLEAERAAAARALQKAQDALAVAQAQYNLAVLGISDTSALRAAEAKVLSAQQVLSNTLSGSDLQTAVWAVQQAELNLKSAQLALANATLTAPANGAITALKADVGEAVGATPIITLAQLEPPLVRFYVEESDLAQVAVGYSVTVVFDAAPDVPFTGKIVQVDPALVTVDGSPAVQAWAQLNLNNSPIPRVSGLMAKVEVTAAQSKKTLLVPVQAMRELAPGSYAVFVVQPDGQLKLTPVTVGLKDFANAEILSGLKAGDVVSTGTVETQ